MTGRPVGKRAPLWIGLGVVGAFALVLFGSARGRAQPGEKDATGVDEARALVAALERRVHKAESDLKEARGLLGRLEAGERPTTKSGRVGAGEAEQDQTDQVEGIWRIVGINGNEGGKFVKPPYDEYKIMSAGHYLWLSFDPDTGKVLRSGGGVYSIKDGVYTAHIECSNSDDLFALIGQEYRGTFKLEGKKWYHFGRVPNGGVFDELWERVH